MSINQEAIEAAARELFFQHSNTNGPSLRDIWDNSLSDDLKEPFMRDARAAVNAAAPFIAIRALQDAADLAFKDKNIQGLQRALIGNWLRARS